MRKSILLFLLLITFYSCTFHDELTVLPELTISHESGIYEEPFYLSLSAPEGYEVYYTLDGSVPTNDAVLYAEPLYIEDQTSQPNNLSTIKTTAVTIGPGWYGGPWKAPSAQIQKGIVIRAVLYKAGEKESEIKTRTFVFRQNNQQTVPTLFLATDTNKFFSYEYGIFVPGRSYDLTLPGVDLIGNPSIDPTFQGNYYQKGASWESPVQMTYLNESGDILFSTNAGVRTAGQVRGQPNHAMNFYFRSEYGKSWIHANLFDDTEFSDFKRLKVRGGGSVWYFTLFNDSIGHSIAQNLDLDIQRSKTIRVFINGEFWGIYNLRDENDEYYLISKYGFSKYDIENHLYFFDNIDYDYGDGKDYNIFLNELNTRVNKKGSLSDEDIEYAETIIDLDNFIDFQAVIECSSSQIYPNSHNEKRWKININSSSSIYADGRWRWMVIDLDGFGGHTLQTYSLFNNSYGPMSYLKSNKNFCISYINRVADLFNSTYCDNRLQEAITQLIQNGESLINEQINRWGYPEESESWTWKEAWEELLSDVNSETEMTQLMNYYNSIGFTISGISQLTVDVNDEAYGYIQVNRLKIDTTTDGLENTGMPYPWHGDYFNDIPVPIKAVPYPGYKFSYFEINGERQETSEDVINIVLSENAIIKACFERI